MPLERKAVTEQDYRVVLWPWAHSVERMLSGFKDSLKTLTDERLDELDAACDRAHLATCSLTIYRTAVVLAPLVHREKSRRSHATTSTPPAEA